jgi:hypothetical protein
MATSTRKHEIDREQLLGLRWSPFVNRAVVVRSAIVAVLIGSVLTLINQSGWVVGSDPLQLLPLILVFVTPFAVVAISQVAAVRRAFIDAARRRSPVRPESFFATTISHGIPASAVAIGLFIGSINAIITLAGALLQSVDLTAVSVAPLTQAYALPLLFGVLSQAISYRRAETLVRKNAGATKGREARHQEDSIELAV